MCVKKLAVPVTTIGSITHSDKGSFFKYIAVTALAEKQRANDRMHLPVNIIYNQSRMRMRL